MYYSITRSTLVALSVLTVCLLLSACGERTASSSPVATAKMTAPKIVPTLTSSVNLTTFSGDGYTIGYPAGWTTKKAGTAVQITQGNNASMVIETVESPAGVSPTGSIQGALAGVKGASKNFQPETVASPITLSNAQWEQGAATAEDPTSGAKATVYILAAKFPNNVNKLIAIVYTAASNDFAKDNTEAFQPMLQSFKFI